MDMQERSYAGVIRPDGSLEVDVKAPWPPRPVEVILKPITPSAPAAAASWYEHLQLLRKHLEDSGHVFRSKEEMDAEIEDLRSDRELPQ